MSFVIFLTANQSRPAWRRDKANPKLADLLQLIFVFRINVMGIFAKGNQSISPSLQGFFQLVQYGYH